MKILHINHKPFVFFLSEQIRTFSKLDVDWLTKPLLSIYSYTIDQPLRSWIESMWSATFAIYLFRSFDELNVFVKWALLLSGISMVENPTKEKIVAIILALIHWVNYRNLTWFHIVEILWKRTVSAEFRGMSTSGNHVKLRYILRLQKHILNKIE